jgi:hypothetical protein
MTRGTGTSELQQHVTRVLQWMQGTNGTVIRRTVPILSSLLILMLPLALPVVAAPPQPFPPVIPLPNGFQPEGIAVGHGSRFFVGSLATGAIYSGDLRTGQGEILVPPQEGRVAVGLSFDPRSNYLFVAGGPTGAGYVYDAATGANVAAYQFTPPGTFVNDVVVTRTGAYFTDSFRPYMYHVPLSARGRLPDPAAVEEIMLGGDFDSVPGAFNANGIDATPNGKSLLIVNSALGTLYRVDPGTGDASLIDLGGGSVPAGDGILLHGKTVYVVQNVLNQIAVVQLQPDFGSGTVVRTISDAPFRVPTTIAEFGDALYAVNARFDVTPGPDTEYEVVQVSKH